MARPFGLVVLHLCSALIQFSPAALREIDRLLRKQSPSASVPLRLRVSMVPGGCEAWTYSLEFAPDAQPDDTSFPLAPWELLVPTDQVQPLTGLVIDYSEDLMGGSFRFDNPSATQTCSCGSSFQVADPA